MSALLDARGCLTPAGMAALREAPVGQAPAELARHLAACGRCQARLLAAGADRRPGEAGSRAADGGARGRWWRAALLVVVALALALAALGLAGLRR